MHENYPSLEEKKWGWAEMNIQKVVSEAWRTQLNHVLLPEFPPPVSGTGHLLEEMSSITKPAAGMVPGTASDFSLPVAVI